MRRVTVIFHEEPDGWWATSPDIPRYSPGAPTQEMLRALVREGIEFYFDDGMPYEIVEELATATAV